MKKLVLILVMLMCIGGINAQDTSISFPKPCSIKGPKWGKDSVKAVQSYSILEKILNNGMLISKEPNY